MDIYEKTVNAIPFRVLIDKRPTDAIELVTDTFTIGPTGSTGDVCIMRLSEIPLEGATGVSGVTGDVTDIAVSDFIGSYNGKDHGVPSSREFLADSDTYKFGYIEFSSDDIGNEVTVTYYGRGSKVFAADVNELSSGALIQDEAIKARHINQSEGFTFSQSLTVYGATGATLISISDNKNVEIGDGILWKPSIFTSDPTPTVAMIPGIYYNSTDGQYKGIVSDGATGARIVILG